MTKQANNNAWRLLSDAYHRQGPPRREDQLEDKLREGVALIGDLRLEAALKLVGELPRSPSDSLLQTDYVQALIDGLCELSSQDALTGLWNRRYFDHRFEQEVRRAQREGRSCAIALIDVDHFKRINDVYGHTTGDLVLMCLAKLIQGQLRTTDEVTSRFGGEEFAVVLPGTPALGAKLALDRLRKRVQDHRFEANGHALSVTISAGVAAYSSSGDMADPQHIFKQADAALYEAKRSGRNRVCVHQAGEDPSGGPITADEKEALLR